MVPAKTSRNWFPMRLILWLSARKFWKVLFRPWANEKFSVSLNWTQSVLKDVKNPSWNALLDVAAIWTVSVIVSGTKPNVYKVRKIFYWPLLIFNKLSECPCEIGCLDGCDECDNPVCDCEVKKVSKDFIFTIFRISRQIKTGISALTITVSLWEDASMLVKAMKAVKLNASIASRYGKPIVRVRL